MFPSKKWFFAKKKKQNSPYPKEKKSFFLWTQSMLLQPSGRNLSRFLWYMKRLGVFLLSLRRDANPLQGYHQHSIRRDPFIHLSRERHCKVSCPRTQHSPRPGLELGHEATAPPLMMKTKRKCASTVHFRLLLNNEWGGRIDEEDDKKTKNPTPSYFPLIRVLNSNPVPTLYCLLVIIEDSEDRLL